MNTGHINYEKKIYTKFVQFSKAVLWKDRQLSIPLPLQRLLQDAEVTKLYFIDPQKSEQWEFDFEKVNQMGERKMVGQEPQWYFPIELAVKKPYVPIYK